MEVLGAVAATAQLVGMVVTILESISQLYDLVKHVPGRYNSWETELAMLKESLDFIRNNSALQTAYIGRIIERMSPKFETLVLLCREHSPGPGPRSFKRALTTLSACKVEPRILQSFESLEHDKTTLILAISLHIISNPIEIIFPDTEEMGKKRNFDKLEESSTQIFSNADVLADYGPPEKALTLRPKKVSNVNRPALFGLITSAKTSAKTKTSQTPTSHALQQYRYSKHFNKPSTSRQNPVGSSTPKKRSGRCNTYSNLDVGGESNVIGNTIGNTEVDTKIYGAKVRGYGHTVGDHVPEIVLKRARIAEKRTNIHKPRPSDYYRESSTERDRG
ncbi:hypothetical protein F5Y12DRAFT_711063 [Xylaria sp. FL1777]|nr:hypothetical protein F5Y12DRAFT_711063 [Xylaria sp. FL1777]